MRPSEISRRLTGFSTPLGGVQWQPADADVTIARRVVRFLEDRRVLFNPSELESPDHCVTSIIEIRRTLTDELAHLDGPREPLGGILTGMRTACRKFLDTAQAVDHDGGLWTPHRGGYPTWRFDTALGELRGVIGIHLAHLAAAYKLDIEDDLATILPAPDTDHDDNDHWWHRHGR
jgi:hypothetical protein